MRAWRCACGQRHHDPARAEWCEARTTYYQKRGGYRGFAQPTQAQAKLADRIGKIQAKAESDKKIGQPHEAAVADAFAARLSKRLKPDRYVSNPSRYSTIPRLRGVD